MVGLSVARNSGRATLPGERALPAVWVEERGMTQTKATRSRAARGTLAVGPEGLSGLGGAASHLMASLFAARYRV
jgi:hypothetical protein